MVFRVDENKGLTLLLHALLVVGERPPLLDTTREDEASVDGVSDAGEKNLLGPGWVLNLNLGIVCDHEYTHSLEFLNGQEPSGACMPIDKSDAEGETG